MIGYCINHVAGGNRAHCCSLPFAVLFEMVQGKGQNLVGREPGAVPIHDAEAVGVAVQSESQLGLAGSNQRRDLAHPLGAGLGRAAAKERVESVAEAYDLGTGLLKECVEIAPAGAVHQLHRDLQFGPADRPQIDELADAFQVGWPRVERPALEGAHHGGLGAPLFGEQLFHVSLDFAGHFAGRARAVGHRILEAGVAERIVAGGDVDAADGFAPSNAEGQHRGGGVAVAEQGFEAVLGQDLRGGQGKFASQETGVVADDNERLAAMERGCFPSQFPLEVKGQPLRGEADVLEGEIPRDQSAPACGAKLNG